MSCGENFNAQLIADYNNTQGVHTTYLSPEDAGILVTDLPQQAQILEQAYERIAQLRNIKGKIIIPGFFGVSKHGYIVTFPRGGSDITGAIIARGVNASLYENFTDVSGILKPILMLLNIQSLLKKSHIEKCVNCLMQGLVSSTTKHFSHFTNIAYLS